MADLHRIGRLASFPLFAKVCAGASAGILLALTLHPRSRSLVVDGFRKPPAVISEETAAPGLPPLPDPSSRPAASYWLSTYIVSRDKGATFGVDQLLLFTEIAQAGRVAEPSNGFWAQVESVAMKDLKNARGAGEAEAAFAAAPAWRLSTKAWDRPVQRALQEWSGGPFAWHREAAAATHEARIGKAFLKIAGGQQEARQKIVSSLSVEARAALRRSMPGDKPFLASWPQWRLSCLLAQCLASAVFLLLVFARGASRWGVGAQWALALALAVVLGLALPTWIPAAAFAGVGACLLTPPRRDGNGLGRAGPLLASALAALSALLPLGLMAEGHGVFSYLAPLAGQPISPWLAGGAVAAGAAACGVKAFCSEEEGEEVEWRLLRGSLWLLGACLLISAASATALLALEQNESIGLAP